MTINDEKGDSLATNHEPSKIMLNSKGDLPEEMRLQRRGEQQPDRPDDNERRPVTHIRPVRISATPGKRVDEKTVTYDLYNSFNYSLFLRDDYKPISLSLGVTSPNQGEGKTTAVCNLSTAIALGMGRKTLVIDLNVRNPQIHRVFGLPKGPGVMEAMAGEEICVSPTEIENLYAMSVGTTPLATHRKAASFRELLASLFQEFEFVLVDMPSVGAGDFPTLIANQLTGLIVVVKSKKTKRADINKLFRRVHKETVLAFVMNEIKEGDF